MNYNEGRAVCRETCTYGSVGAFWLSQEDPAGHPTTCAGRGCSSRLRCTLMGFERNYKIRIHYNQIYIQERLFYSYKTQTKSFAEKPNITHKMNPWFVTGLVDGEGCFRVSVTENKNLKHGWRVQLFFLILLHSRDEYLLKEIQASFSWLGSIIKNRKIKSILFQVQSIKDLKLLIEHFDKYPLITDKYFDYKLFKQAFELIEQREHLTFEGLCKIVAIKASVNWGLPEKLLTAFPDVVAVSRPKIQNKKIPSPYWLAGFISGEGCFMVIVQSSSTHHIGFQTILRFQITQHYRDKELMNNFINYLDCGYVCKDRKTIHFKVEKFSDIVNKIIPFLKKYPIKGVKLKDFDDWCRVAELMKEKKHLTQEGLVQIRKIKASMNKGRVVD